MPPLVQSSNWISLARQAGKILARASTRPTNAKKVKPINISSIPQQAKQLIRHTFPSLFTPAHLLELQPAYISRSSGSFSRAAQLNRASNPLHQAVRGFRTTARNARPTVPAPVNVGLGTARGYASSGAASHQMMSAKVPMMMRALASLLDNELELNATLPHPSKYTPYDIRRISKVSKAIAISQFTSESDDEVRRTLAVYFTPAPASKDTSVLASSSQLLEPSQLITLGAYTTLTIPLEASFHSILEVPTQEPYAESDLGVRKFASLLKGILTPTQIIQNRSSHFLIPLFNKLDSLGITFDPNFSGPKCEQWVSFINIDDYQLADTISVKFHDRSSEDVKRILGESLRSAEEGVWWAITEYRINPDMGRGMDHITEAAMQEGWNQDDHSSRASNELDTSQLVMPLIDLDESGPYHVHQASNGHEGDWTDIESNAPSPSTPSTVAEESRVFSHESPYSEDMPSVRSDSFASTLSDHLNAVQYELQEGSDGGSLAETSDEVSDPARLEWQVSSDSD